MLIYNYQKEFIGIDQHDLEALGFTDLVQLQSEAGDFADLFVKTPGYIPNFKDVHWIDFVTCSGSSEDSKVIIHANGKNFKAVLDIKTAFLIDNPSEKGYLINLVNLRELTHDETEKIAGDLLERPAPQKASARPATIFNTPEFSDKFEPTEAEESPKETAEKEELIIDPYEHDVVEEESKKEVIDAYDTKPAVIEEDVYESPVPDEPLNLDIEEDFVEEKAAPTEEKEIISEPSIESVEESVTPSVVVEPEVTVEPETTAEAVVEAAVDEEDPDFDNSYMFDPNVASAELGLPVELIEEFIQDFITQAHDFKEQLYSSFDKGDMDNVKILSHKLKGVAANLRIEDAFETLVTINTSNDQDLVKTNLNRFYKIIDKLSSGKRHEEEAPVIETPSETEEEEDFVLDFKDDLDFKKDDVAVESQKEPEKAREADLKDDTFNIDDDFIADNNKAVHDNDVPDKIDVVELADDSFLNKEETQELDYEVDDLKYENHESETDAGSENKTDTQDDILDDFVYDAGETQSAPQDNNGISYDKDSIAEDIGIDRETFNELFNEYMSDGQLICENVKEAIEQNNPDVWKSNAVRLKGMSDNMRILDFIGELDEMITTDDAQIAKKNIEIINAKLEQISNLEG